MENGERIDRRATGVQRVIATNGNGDKDDTLQFNVRTARAWVGFAAAIVSLLLVVGGAVMGGVKYGINSEVHEKVEDKIKIECEPKGMIDVHVRQISEEYMDEVQGVLQDDLDDFDGRMRVVEFGQMQVKGSVDALASTSERNVEEIKMLIQQAIDGGGG